MINESEGFTDAKHNKPRKAMLYDYYPPLAFLFFWSLPVRDPWVCSMPAPDDQMSQSELQVHASGMHPACIRQLHSWPSALIIA